MAETKHTAGPWQVMNEYDGANIVIANVDGETFSDGTSTFSFDFVCDTLPDDGDGSRSRQIAAANARLIAAAPEMLEALIMVRDADDDCKSDGLSTIPSMARATIDSALAKAEGR